MVFSSARTIAWGVGASIFRVWGFRGLGGLEIGANMPTETEEEETWQRGKKEKEGNLASGWVVSRRGVERV